MSADEARRLARVCWKAAREIAERESRYMGPSVGGLASARQKQRILSDLGRHLGERRGDYPPRALPSAWCREGRDARVELLSLAAEYYEAVAEGRVRS